MTKSITSSRARILRTIRHAPTDHLPLCFEGICHGAPRFLVEAVPDPLERARYYLSREIDTAVTCSPPSVSSRSFDTREWSDHPSGERHPVLHKEYRTPAGSLWQVVRKTADYPDQVDLFSDHNVPPGRSKAYLVSEEKHLAPLEWILQAPDDGELAEYFDEARHVREFCTREGLLMATYLPGVGDALIWLSGVEGALLAALDRPSFLQRYAEIIARWNERLLEIALEAGCDHVVRRGWYESTSFWSPGLYRRFLLEPLKREVCIAHQAGATYAYVMNTGSAPPLPYFAEAGIDVLSNLDPRGPGTDLRATKQDLGQSIALCGGVG